MNPCFLVFFLFLFPMLFSSHEGGFLVTSVKIHIVTQNHGPWTPNTIFGPRGSVGDRWDWPSIWVPTTLAGSKVRVTQNFNCSTKYIRIDLLLFIFYISVSHGCRNTYIFVLSQPQILGHHTELVCCSIIKLTGLVVEEHVLRRCCSNCDTSTQQTLVMEASFFGMLFEM